jgi:hypothetical protein
MALNRKGSRTMSVNGAVYRWRVRRKPTYCQEMAWGPMSYAVESAENPGCVLVVLTADAHPGNCMGRPVVPVLPSDVAASIREARARGWAPDRPGKPYVLDLSASPTAAS